MLMAQEAHIFSLLKRVKRKSPLRMHESKILLLQSLFLLLFIYLSGVHDGACWSSEAQTGAKEQSHVSIDQQEAGNKQDEP